MKITNLIHKDYELKFQFWNTKEAVDLSLKNNLYK